MHIQIDWTLNPKHAIYWLLLHGAEILALIIALAIAFAVGRRWPRHIRWLPYLAALFFFFFLRWLFLKIVGSYPVRVAL